MSLFPCLNGTATRRYVLLPALQSSAARVRRPQIARVWRPTARGWGIHQHQRKKASRLRCASLLAFSYFAFFLLIAIDDLVQFLVGDIFGFGFYGSMDLHPVDEKTDVLSYKLQGP